MARSYYARLVGGPFDGDAGPVSSTPPSVWVYVLAPGAIAWADDADAVPEDAEAERYDLAEDAPDRLGVYVYVYPEDVEPVDALRERELAVA